MTTIRDELIEIIGYSAEVAEPDGTPITAFYTDRHLHPILTRLVEYVEAQRHDAADRVLADVRTAVQREVDLMRDEGDRSARFMRHGEAAMYWSQAHAYRNVLTILDGGESS